MLLWLGGLARRTYEQHSRNATVEGSTPSGTIVSYSTAQYKSSFRNRTLVIHEQIISWFQFNINPGEVDEIMLKISTSDVDFIQKLLSHFRIQESVKLTHVVQSVHASYL